MTRCVIPETLTALTSIAYTITLSAGGSDIDTTSGTKSITSDVSDTTINFDFQQYYFKVTDWADALVSSGITLKVATTSLSLNGATTYYTYDTIAANAVLV